MKRAYSTSDLARMWNLSESTVKRWADTGLLRCSKTAGGHRKFDLSAICEFQQKGNIPATGPVVDDALASMEQELERLFEKPDMDGIRARYTEIALAGTEKCLAALLARLYLRGVKLVTIYEEIVAPALHCIGQGCLDGRLELYQAHIAARATLMAATWFQASISAESFEGRVALVGCAEGEFHEVAPTLIGHSLTTAGWNVVNLGAHTPFSCYAEAMERYNADVVCISVTVGNNVDCLAEGFPELHSKAEKRGARVFLGGAAMDTETRQRFPLAHHASTITELLKAVGV